MIYRGLVLYVDHSPKSSEAINFLRQYNFQFAVIRTEGIQLPLLRNGDLVFGGLSGIKHFIWARTPLIYNKEHCEDLQR